MLLLCRMCRCTGCRLLNRNIFTAHLILTFSNTPEWKRLSELMFCWNRCVCNTDLVMVSRGGRRMRQDGKPVGWGVRAWRSLAVQNARQSRAVTDTQIQRSWRHSTLACYAKKLPQWRNAMNSNELTNINYLYTYVGWTKNDVIDDTL